MTIQTENEQFRKLVLQAEIAALLHDIGKFTREFAEAGVKGGGNISEIHTKDFMDKDKGMIVPKLAEILTAPLENGWLQVPDKPGEKAGQMQRLGDILRFHHSDPDEIVNEFKLESEQPYHLLFYLAMFADTIDSASSKGFSKNDWLILDNFRQTEGAFYMASPLGERELFLDLDRIGNESRIFQSELVRILSDFQSWNFEELKRHRNSIIALFKEYLSKVLAETRLPTNDVSLWQHTYSTASIFKAMLARHLLIEDYHADENRLPAYYKEKLAYLGIRWNEDEFLARSYRPKEILGRRFQMMKIKDRLKDIVETEYCIGNEVYQDRNGICFLIPSSDEDNRIKSYVKELADDLESELNNAPSLGGDFSYDILCKDIGIQVLGLGELLEGKVEPLRKGPTRPKWIEFWDKSDNSKEICSRCGLKPVIQTPITVGSEKDESAVCASCIQLGKEGKLVRDMQSVSIRFRLIGTKKTSNLVTYKTEDFFSDDEKYNRVALIQGILDLSCFMNGKAFSSILMRSPNDYKPTGNKNDISTWDDFIKEIQDCLDKIKNGRHSQIALKRIRKVFVDSRIGSEKDGRVQGDTGIERLINYFENIVFRSPFPANFTDAQKLTHYALRQHPAPSRLARIWETTETLCRYSVDWCEENKTRYFPLSMDPGRFLILLPAKKAWDFIHAMYQKYLQTAGRVQHLLPLHLSAAVFYHKAPLYIGIDAMRRFSEISARKGEKVWTLADKNCDGEQYHLTWADHKGRTVNWKMPATMPNGKEERFFSWFRVQGEDRPFSLKELRPGQQVFVRPSTFDYEVLDTTTRRYDIRMNRIEEREGRPHYFCGETGPRPYPLSYIETWQEIMNDEKLRKVDPSQKNRLISFLAAVHTEWKGCDPATFRRQTADYLSLCLGKENAAKFTEAAVSGQWFDLHEWQHFISK